MNEERRGRSLQDRAEKADENDFYTGLANLLVTREGRRFVWIYVNGLGYNSEPFSGESPHQTAFLLGKKAAAEALISEIRNKHHAQYLIMLEEAYNVQTERMAAATQLREARRQRDPDAERRGHDPFKPRGPGDYE